MQELAARLGEPAVRVETETALLQLLRSRKLEAEVVEVLCIFWMAAKGHSYSPVAKLAKSIPKPSLLSDLVVASLGLSVQAGGTDLKEVPEDFEIPDDFDGVQGVDLPRIFWTSMSRLETYSGLPFVRQMAFEWTENRAAYPDAPYQGDAGHFIRPLGDGFIGQLSTRTALRAISAYLRTMAVAKHFWKMPPEFADQESLLALPLHPTLALLKPRRPDWFPAPTDFDGGTDVIEASFRDLVCRVQAVRPGDELIAFSSPIVMAMGRCVEVSIVRWSQAADSNIADADLAAHLEGFWTHGGILSSAAPEPLSTTTLLAFPHLNELMYENCKAWPLAVPLDFDRLGYLQHDLYPWRLFLPALTGSNRPKLSPREGQLEIKVDEQVVADLCYWNAGWGAARPIQFGGNCGTALISRGTDYREGVASTNVKVRSFYLWQVKTLQRNSSNEELGETLSSGIMFV
ncbi:hypothetical protein R3F64_15105 [Halomonas sp. 5021]|jgi:hypothetical protein|uniref:hypothetical protein n=1 Tax=Halomonas sp. 5021 TaxID=3082156 RepID=UPI002FC910F3